MRIGIYGGSFNPIHKGHTGLARWIVEQGLVDGVWMLVSPQNPLKTGRQLMDDELRLRLAKLAVEEEERLAYGCSRGRIRVSDFEFQLPRPSFTVDTLAALKRTYPEHEFVLIIGADNWLAFPKWHKGDEILASCNLIIYPRPGYNVDKKSLPSGVRLVQPPLFDISSTEIRKQIATNPSYSGEGLAASVWREILTVQEGML
ncbi:MAG: nicotinate-nucleotide adenylyltransferase [Bacteroidaceae bacterium]|nr:nicotinate-nucleotide adenylyltransferase [Bacteroidaceae bacterium]